MWLYTFLLPYGWRHATVHVLIDRLRPMNGAAAPNYPSKHSADGIAKEPITDLDSKHHDCFTGSLFTDGVEKGWPILIEPKRT